MFNVRNDYYHHHQASFFYSCYGRYLFYYGILSYRKNVANESKRNLNSTGFFYVGLCLQDTQTGGMSVDTHKVGFFQFLSAQTHSQGFGQLWACLRCNAVVGLGLKSCASP